MAAAGPAGVAAASVAPVPAEPTAPVTPKGDATRQAILTTALRLFEERGYEGTTMRAVASEAGVSLGNAYYYFSNKEHLVQAFYDRIQEQHRAAASEQLAGRRSLEDRLHAVITSWVDVAAPYHRFAGQFFKVAAEPSSPNSPFSEQSRPAREAAIGLFAEALAGSDVTVPADLAERLPELLWLGQMGVVLFWVHDTSDGQARTRALAERVVPLVARLVGLARLRPLRPVVRQVLDLLEAVAPSTDRAPAEGPQSGGGR